MYHLMCPDLDTELILRLRLEFKYILLSRLNVVREIAKSKF